MGCLVAVLLVVSTLAVRTAPVRADWRGEANQPLAEYGGSVATAGDVNGDGYDDVIVGAALYSHGQSSEGRAFVYEGSAVGLSTRPAWSAEGDQAAAYFGHAVATAGDVNGDGYDDVIVGADLFDGGQDNEGKAFAYYGSPSGLSATPNWTAEGNQLDAIFGSSVGTAGDVNGDGYDDVIVGALEWTNGQSGEGAAFVYLGSPSGLSTGPAWTAQGDQVSAEFGSAVGMAGDVNGDGYDDVIVGATEYDHGQTDEGAAFVFQGSATGLSTAASWMGESNADSSRFGVSAGTAGDVNGDGFSDVVVGAYTYLPGGRAYAYYGSPLGLSLSPNWIGKTSQSGADLGISVASAGDTNGDGFDDVLVGANLFDHGQTDEGRAFTFLGSASGLAGTPAWIAEADQDGAYFGFSTAGAGDVNGDALADRIVGAVFYEHGQFHEGAAFAYDGSVIAAPPPRAT